MSPDQPHSALRFLQKVLVLKISVTALLWAGPLLLLPESAFEALMGQVPDPINYARLLGLAYLALMTNYICGFIDASKGVVPWTTIYTGLVSNGGGALLLVYLSVTGSGSPSPLTLVSIGLVGVITLGLTISWARLRSSDAPSTSTPLPRAS
ncbi:MAG: hypothetical protein COA62_00730 [Rhodobiaceae bacterium]|nr:MAG: hypothetical protein COA62_00730 [Rhodobiaceae bacterium]